MRPVEIKKQRGLSLVELMVGVTIGLVAAMLMMQIAVVFDRYKRGSTGSGEAQNAGAVAMYTLETDLRQAGYGLVGAAQLGCIMDTSLAPNGRPFVPAMILPDGMLSTHANNLFGLPPGDAGSDILVVMYSDNPATPEGEALFGFTGSTGYTLEKNVTGFKLNDFAMIFEAGKHCTIGQILAFPDVAANPQRQMTLDFARTATYTGSGFVSNLGPNGITMRAYAVRGGNLTVCDLWNQDCAGSTASTVWQPIASNIVALRAQYGWDTSATANMQVDAYCRSLLTTTLTTCPTTDDGQTAPATVPTTSAHWLRLASLRVALVSRSAERDPAVVSDAVLTLWPSVATGTAAPPTVAPTYNVPDQNYRYKVFQSTVPIRNVIWRGGV